MTATRTILSAVLALPLTFSMLVGCAAGDEPAADPEARTDEALVTNPCATVLCVLGTHCEVQARRPVCVPDPHPAQCRTDADCRLFDDYCDGCACRALPTRSKDPVCTGTTVACFAQPCAGRMAVCSRGACIVE